MPSENTRRIAKNTAMLYIRMLLIMVVSLYTSRVVLNVLGVEDFGIYNVVGGVVTMLAFFNYSLSIATQRFLNCEMGQGGGELKKVFSIALTGHYLIAVGVIVLGETIGLWFVNTQLVIPPEKMSAAIWVYHFAVLNFVVNIISTPYNAAIIAHERMNIFAYISILEVVLKLLIVFLLVYLPYNKLELYGFLLLCVAVLIRSVYAFYCRHCFDECQYHFVWDKVLFKRMFSFSGWILAGTSTGVFSSQGVNLLINIFFGPLQNAARGIAYQLQGAVNAFVSNFMTAVQPQVFKSYTQGDYFYMYRLVFGASKFSFYLLYLLSLPLLLQTRYLLELWLKIVPEYTVIFTQLVIVELLISSSYNPIAMVSQASGKIRNYQFIVSAGNVLVFLLSLLFFKLGFTSVAAFVVGIIIAFTGLFARLWELHRSVCFPVGRYLYRVFIPEIKVALIGLLFPL